MKKTRAVLKKSINNADLSNDVKALKQRLLAAEEKLKNRESVVSQLQNHIRHLEEIVKLFKANKFGKSSEKSPDQAELFDEVEACDSDDNWVAEAVESEENSEPETVPSTINQRQSRPQTHTTRIPSHYCRTRSN